MISRTNNDTVEKRIQGGINAANGVQSSFKVYPVQMVTKTPKLKRENEHSKQQRGQTGTPISFDTVLEKKIEKECPADCYVVTYNVKSQLQTYYYHQSREYTF